MLRRVVWGVLIIWATAAMLGLATRSDAEAETARESRAASAAIEKKLQEVLDTQQLILQKLDAMAEELRIIKVRSTR